MKSISDEPAKIVFLDRGTLAPEIRFAEFAFPHHLIVHERTRPSDVAERIRDADIVINNKVKITREAVEVASRLRLIGIAATGTDCIDLQACDARQVAVVNVRNYAALTVPEHTFALILALRTGTAVKVRFLRTGMVDLQVD